MCFLSGNSATHAASSWLQTTDRLARRGARVRLWSCSYVPAASGSRCWKVAGRLPVSVKAGTDADWLVAGRGAAGSTSPSESCPCCACCSERGGFARSQVTRMKLWRRGYRRHPATPRRRKVEALFLSFHSSGWGIQLSPRKAAERKQGNEFVAFNWRPSIPNSMRCSYGRQG